MRKREKKICIIVINHLGGNILKECVTSILTLTNYTNYKLIIIDDYPNDRIVDEIKREFREVKIISLNTRVSTGYARNIGIEYAIIEEKADYIIFLDNDVKVVDGNWIRKLLKLMDKDKKIGVIAPVIYTQEYYQTFTKKDVDLIRYIPGACIMVRKEVFQKIGGFDVNFWPLGNDDSDFLNRVISSGFKVAITGKTRIFHNTTTKKRRSIFWSFINTRNYLRYILLNVRINNLYEIFSLIVIRKNLSDSFRPSNLIFSPDWYVRLVLLPLALLSNLRSIREILKLRRNRSGFYFLSHRVKNM